jgi:hypothetical protein
MLMGRSICVSRSEACAILCLSVRRPFAQHLATAGLAFAKVWMDRETPLASVTVGIGRTRRATFFSGLHFRRAAAIDRGRILIIFARANWLGTAIVWKD